MIRTAILCDFCDQPLPVETIEGLDCAKYYVTKEWDTRKRFPCLCERCATKLDQAFSDMKNGMTHRRQLLIKFKQVNDERRKRLATDG